MGRAVLPSGMPYAMTGTDLRYAATRSGQTKKTRARTGRAESTKFPVKSAICLRASYAKPGTDLACDATRQRACYAKPGTELAHSDDRY
eukprot:569890-Rhodomonas_salina.2